MKNNFNNIPLSILDLAVVLAEKTPLQTFKNSVALAQKAESLDYKRFWLSEHHNMPHIVSSATSILIGHIAEHTKKIRVGSGGIMLPNHAPLIIAEQFGTLATLFPGRIDLGLGRAPGTDQLTAKALQRNDQAAYEFPNTVLELQEYLSIENSDAAVRAIPGEGLDIPIWILGSSTDSARLAASLGLPYAFASHFAPQQLMQALAIYRANFKPSQYLKEPYVLACVNVTAAETSEEASALATSMEKVFLGILTNNRKPLQPADPNFRVPEEAKQVMQQFLHYSFVGDPSEIKSQLEDFVAETNVDELMVVSHIYDFEARLKSYEIIKEAQQ